MARAPERRSRSQAPARPRSTPKTQGLAIVALLTVGLATAIGLGFRRTPANEPMSTSPAPAVSDVHLLIESTAPHADVRIDDGPIHFLPFDSTTARDAAEHVIVVSAEGYAPRTKTVRFSSDRVVVSVPLTRLDDP
jgi:hypothetical protein